MPHPVITIYDDAIRRRRLLVFDYHGHRRIVQPHIHGENRQEHEALSGVQVGGSSNAGGLGWKSFLIDDITGRPHLGDSFGGPAPGYNPNDPSFKTIYSRL
jgi:hypothetical protein